MSSQPTFLQLMQALSARNARFNQLFGNALSQLDANPPLAIPALDSCRAEAEGILQDHAVIARRNQEFWQGQVANLHYWQGQAFMLCCRRVDARRCLEQARASIPANSTDGTEARLDALEAQLAEEDGRGDPAQLYDTAIAGFSRIESWVESAQTSYVASVWAMRNGQYEAFHRFIRTGIEIAETHSLQAANINFRIQRVRCELLANYSALDMDSLRQQIDYSFDLRGDLAVRLHALYDEVPAAFALVERLLIASAAEFDAAVLAQALATLGGYAAAFGQAVFAMRLNQAAQQIGQVPNGELVASLGILVQQSKQSLEQGYAALCCDALILANEFKSKLGDFDTASEALDQAERTARGNPTLLRAVYMARADLFEAQNDLQSAVTAAERAVQVAQNISPILAEQAQLKLNRLRVAGAGKSAASSAEDKIYDAALQAQELFRRKLPADALPVLNAALEIANTPMLRRTVLVNRAVALLDLQRYREAISDIQDALHLHDSAGADDHAAASDDLGNRIKEEENLRLMEATAEARLGNSASAWIAAEQGRASVLKRDIARKSGGVGAWPGLSFAEIQPWLTREAVAILTFGATRYGTLVLSAGPAEAEPRAEILPLTARSIEGLLASDDIFSAVPELSANLLHPLRDRILEITRQAQVLYLVPESGLFHVPLAALTIEEATARGARTLLDLCPVALTPSLAILLACASRRRPARGEELLAVAVGEAGDGPNKIHFRNQAERVASLPWKGKPQTLLDDEATIERVAECAPRFPVIFIAAHGRLDTDVRDTMAASRIEFAQKQLLSSRNVLDWRLAAELVFLNACQSGRFLVTGRSQVNGFFRAFPVAGANTLIATLTYVDPEAASQMAELFFRNWLGGATKVEALRSAQQEVRKTRPVNDWASHCLVGDFV